MFPWFNFWNILNVCILNTNTWIGIIKFWGHHTLKIGIIYSNGGHIGFNYTHISLTGFFFQAINNPLTPRGPGTPLMYPGVKSKFAPISDLRNWVSPGALDLELGFGCKEKVNNVFMQGIMYAWTKLKVFLNLGITLY